MIKAEVSACANGVFAGVRVLVRNVLSAAAGSLRVVTGGATAGRDAAIATSATEAVVVVDFGQARRLLAAKR